MAFQVKDRIKQTVDAPATTSPFDFDSNGATPTGYISFETGLADADTCIYTAEDASGNWEVGVGTWAETAKTLTRTTILSSSTGSAVTFSGSITVYGSVDASTIRNCNLRTKDASVTTADVTGEVGTMHVLDVSGLTADRSFALPATCAVGDRVGVMISVGDGAYELLLKPATGDTINGGTAGAEWSRLFITGEVVIFRCITADSAWIVEYDGRIPAYCMWTGIHTHTTSGGAEYVDFASESADYELGNLFNAANDRIDLRRYNTMYYISAYVTSAIGDGKYLKADIENKDSSDQAVGYEYSPGAAKPTTVHIFTLYRSLSDDYFKLAMTQDDSTSETLTVLMEVHEVL